jgi:membrane protease YdiL (CAAX protease family)
VPFPTYLEAVLMSVAWLGFELVASVAMIVALMVTSVGASEEALETTSELLFILSAPTVVPFLAWGVLRRGRRVTETLALRKVSLGVLLAVVPAILGTDILLSELDNLLRTYFPLPNFFEGEMAGLLERPVLGFIIVAGIAPLVEEPMFRGLLLNGLVDQGRRWGAVVVTALLFAIVHVNPAQIPFAFFFGLFVGWVFLRTRSVWPCILAHAVSNSEPHFVKYVFPIEIPGFSMTGEPGVFQPLWLDAVGVVLLAIGMAAILAATGKSASNETKDTG